MNEKIVIATPVDYGNFGNRLQNYAVHEICRKLGWNPVTAAVENSYVKGKIAKHNILDFIERFHLHFIISRFPKLKKLTKSLSAWKFTKENIPTKYIKNERDLQKLCKDAKFVGIGGDQIFAPYWRNVIWFATFPMIEYTSKICFAPSFGSDNLPIDYINNFVKKEIPTIEHLAVRELSGVKIVERFAGISAERMCDPVVLLTKEEWLARCKTHFIDKKKNYSLVYFLGAVHEAEENAIFDYTVQKNLHIVNVSKCSTSIESTCDPLQFVSYLSQTEILFTDSFHAVMLALILNKKVVVFDRVGGMEMNTRIEELISRYNIFQCKFNCENGICGEYDKEYVNRVLANERKHAFDYYKRFS